MPIKKEYRLMEVRAAAEPDESTEMIVEGYAIRFNEPAMFDIMGEQYQEIIDPGALD